jgi:polyisoprenoid-binding protein YceI
MEYSMKKHFAACVLAGLLAVPAIAADTYTMDPEYTIPAFEVEHFGFSTQRGRFDKSEGKVMLDFAAKKGLVEFTVFTNSLDMGSRAWTVHVSSAGLFNIEEFPTMTFKSDKLVFEGNKVVAAEGQFTLLGVTKPIKVAVNRFTCGNNPVNKKAMCAGDISATIKRSDFGMTKYIPTVSDEIKINVPVEAYKDK